MADERDLPSVVPNEMFVGMGDISERMFRGEVARSTLLKWVRLAGFPAAPLPAGKSGTRATTWGLVETWMISLLEWERSNSFDTVARELLSWKNGTLLKKLYLGSMTNEELKEFIDRVETWTATTAAGEKARAKLERRVVSVIPRKLIRESRKRKADRDRWKGAAGAGDSAEESEQGSVPDDAGEHGPGST